MILVYNPTCEMAVRYNTVNYQPPANLLIFEKKLASLMMFLTTEGDFVVADSPDERILNFWYSCGLSIPNFINASEARKRVMNGEELRPWGVSKEVLYRFGGKSLASQFTNEHRLLFSRLSSVALDNALSELLLPSWCQQPKFARIVESVDELVTVASKGKCVLKSLWSASGRGVTLLNASDHVVPAVRRYEACIKTDGAVVCEPLLSRVVDFAMLFSIDKSGKVVYLGKNFYRSDDSGRFGYELIGHNPLQQYIDAGDLPTDWEQVASQALVAAIEQMKWNRLYTGPLGVDSMLYRDADNKLKVRLCIEVNIRYTMGNINMAVAKLLGPLANGEWRIGSDTDWQDAAHDIDAKMCNGDIWLCEMAHGKIDR